MSLVPELRFASPPKSTDKRRAPIFRTLPGFYVQALDALAYSVMRNLDYPMGAVDLKQGLKSLLDLRQPAFTEDEVHMLVQKV